MQTSNPAVKIVDVTLRDGEQTQGVSFSRSEKESIARALLDSLKIDRIEVASAGISAGEREAVQNINQWAARKGYLDQIEVLGFVDHKRSVDWISGVGGKVINLLTKGSEKHCREQLGKTLTEHLDGISRTVEYASDQGLMVNLYLEDWSNGYVDSPQYVFDMMKQLQSLPIEHFMLPDTLGVMSPGEVYDSFSDMINRFPDCRLDFHPHNDYGLGTANCMAAVRAGAASVHCTVNCLGERAGNASLAEICLVLKDKLGAQLRVEEHEIYNISRMVENFSGKMVAGNAPVIGTDVFTQTAGIHADGDQKGDLYQTRLSPDRFNRTRSYALGKMSGKASLQKNLETLGISLSPDNQMKVLERVVELGDSKESITPEDLPLIIADVLETRDEKVVELLNCSITSVLGLDSVVSISVRLFDKTLKSTGTGNGGFDAFIVAAKKVLDGTGFEFPELVDYQVRIPKGGKTSALVECFITWQDGTRKIRTRGINANQVFAGIEATLRMLNLKLAPDQV